MCSTPKPHYSGPRRAVSNLSFTPDMMQRFSETANLAQERREKKQAAVRQVQRESQAAEAQAGRARTLSTRQRFLNWLFAW